MADKKQRRKLEKVLLPLTNLSKFSRDDVAEIVGEVNAGYVTRLLNRTVEADLLEKYALKKEVQFRWAVKEPETEIRDWIDRQVGPEPVAGDQVKQMPEKERPRERLIADGAGALSIADLLAILVRSGQKNESATTAGRKLANQFADALPRLRLALQSELHEISKAITKPAYCQIMAGIELGRRMSVAEQFAEPELTRITSTAEAIEYCARKFAYLAGDGVQEEFHIVTLDTKHKPIHTHRITVGTLDASLVHPREVFRAAIRDSAAAVLLVHNHPSGDPTPSREDHQVTDRLTEAGKLIGITVLDHVVVARQRSVSLREESA